MERNKNIVRLNEEEFNKLIQESVIQVLNEGRFGDMAKRLGKGVGKAAIYGALGAGSLYAIDKGLQNQERYENELNKQGMEMQGPSEDEVNKFMSDNQIEDTPENREDAWEYLNNMMKTESKKHIGRVPLNL